MTQCPACGTLNGTGRSYCGSCARAIGVLCPVCAFVNEPVHRYCGGCAGDLCAAPLASAQPVRAAAAWSNAPANPVAFATPPPAPAAKPDRATLISDLGDLDDLAFEGPAAPCGESCPTTAADATQSCVDAFFQKLAGEGSAEINPTLAPAPGAARRAPS